MYRCMHKTLCVNTVEVRGKDEMNRSCLQMQLKHKPSKIGLDALFVWAVFTDG